jgi:type II secretory pathway pseudopilin PulG
MRREPSLAIRGSAMGAVLPRKTGMTGAFTLVEIVLAMALSALLLTIVYWTYFSVNRSVDAATEGQDALDTGRILSELIKRDIRAIRPTPYALVGNNTMIQNSSFGELEFVTNALSGTDPQRLRRVGYTLILSDDDEKTLVRRESTDLSDLLDKSPADYLPKVFEVSTIITGFLVEFYNGADWVQTWDSGVTGQIPTQIRVTIDVSDAKGKTRRFVAEEAIQSQAVQSAPSASQSGQTTSQSGQTTSQSGQNASQSGQTTSQSGQTTSQSGQNASQ